MAAQTRTRKPNPKPICLGKFPRYPGKSRD